MDFLTTLISSAAVVSLVLTIMAKLLPNDRLRRYGVNLGKVITGFGSSKLGKRTWEDLENFFTDSLGVFFSGVKVGLNSDDDQPSSGKTQPNIDKEIGNEPRT